MHTRQFNARKLSSADQRMLVLTYLIALGNVGIKIIFPVEFSIIRQLAENGRPQAQHRPYGFFVDDRQSARVAHANRADVYIRPHFIWIALRIAEHLGSGLQFSMYLEPYRKPIIFNFHWKLRIVNCKFFRALSSKIEIGTTVSRTDFNILIFSSTSCSEIMSALVSNTTSGFLATFIL